MFFESRSHGTVDFQVFGVVGFFPRQLVDQLRKQKRQTRYSYVIATRTEDSYQRLYHRSVRYARIRRITRQLLPAATRYITERNHARRGRNVAKSHFYLRKRFH